jgi:hypothetical protein
MNTIKHTIDDIESLPPQIYKYYKFDAVFNEKRLTGQVFFSSPLKFNDPLDSQLDVINNHNVLNDVQLWDKFVELGYEEADVEAKIEELKEAQRGDSIITEVHKRQLEKCGILCLSEDEKSPIMWAHYANNDGYCVEYDTSNFLRDIVIGFVNEMPLWLTEHLVHAKKYCARYRDKESRPQRTKYADTLFTHKDISQIRNEKLIAMPNEEERLYFLQNIYVKRLWGRHVEYSENLGNVKPLLFMNNEDKFVNKKYYIKFKPWEHEKEYRLILSLGGNMPIKLPTTTITSIILGCNVSNENICSLLSILNTDNTKQKINIGKIVKIDNGFDINYLNLSEMLEKYNKLIKSFGNI